MQKYEEKLRYLVQRFIFPRCLRGLEFTYDSATEFAFERQGLFSRSVAIVILRSTIDKTYLLHPFRDYASMAKPTATNAQFRRIMALMAINRAFVIRQKTISE